MKRLHQHARFFPNFLSDKTKSLNLLAVLLQYLCATNFRKSHLSVVRKERKEVAKCCKLGLSSIKIHMKTETHFCKFSLFTKIKKMSSISRQKVKAIVSNSLPLVNLR